MDEQEYLNLFKKTQSDNQWGSLNETPKYDNFERLNETPDVSKYTSNEQINDGWSNEMFVVETRVNGIPQSQNPNYNSHSKRANRLNDPNGLGQYLDDENINEVYRNPVVQQPIVQAVVPTGPVLEHLQDVDVVSVELFNQINEKAFTSLTRTPVYDKMIRS